MKQLISKKLEVLKGRRMWTAGRTMNLVWFHFSLPSLVESREGEEIVSEYALHIQCSWRISSPQGIIVASGDRTYPRGDPYSDDEFDWTEPGANRCDEKLKWLFSSSLASYLIVTSVTSDALGGANIYFERKMALHIFPDDSVLNERWRFFQPQTNGSLGIAVEISEGRLRRAGR